MSRWLISMEGTVQDKVADNVKNEVQVIDNLSGHPNKDNKDIEKQKSFDERENNPEGKGTNIPIGISEVSKGVKD